MHGFAMQVDIQALDSTSRQTRRPNDQSSTFRIRKVTMAQYTKVAATS